MNDRENLIDAAEAMSPDEIHQHPMAALDKLRALARELRLVEKAHIPPADLIEEAAKAIHADDLAKKRANEAFESMNPETLDWYRDNARAALAVFEKVHTPSTPTNDERAIDVCIEIASTVYGDYDDAQGALSDIHMMLAPIAAGFRRSEVPEPSGPWDLPTSCFGHCDKEGWYGECVSKKADAEVEPQGVPSDAQVEFPFTYKGVTLEQDDGGVWVSDAGGSSYWISPLTLAALRAASAVQGENR